MMSEKLASHLAHLNKKQHELGYDELMSILAQLEPKSLRAAAALKAEVSETSSTAAGRRPRRAKAVRLQTAEAPERSLEEQQKDLAHIQRILPNRAGRPPWGLGACMPPRPRAN